jgi:hypothetical protein
LIVVNLKKLFLGLIGSVCLYLIINNFIVELSVWKYILIEGLITLSHWIYDQIKTTIDEDFLK